MEDERGGWMVEKPLLAGATFVMTVVDDDEDDGVSSVSLVGSSSLDFELSLSSDRFRLSSWLSLLAMAAEPLFCVILRVRTPTPKDEGVPNWLNQPAFNF